MSRLMMLLAVATMAMLPPPLANAGDGRDAATSARFAQYCMSYSDELPSVTTIYCRSSCGELPCRG